MGEQSDRPPGAARHGEAPVSYDAVQRAYNTMRVVAGLILAAGGLLVWALEESAAAPWVLTAGLVLTADGLYRRSHGTGAQPLLIIDITVLGALLVTQGHTPSIEAVGSIHVFATALLLLRRRDAYALIGFAAAWGVPIVLLAPVVDSTTAHHPVLETVSAAAYLAIVGQLLVSTIRALRIADQRQRDALETERRAVAIKNEFVSMVSHELRTPLTSIAGFTDALKESWASLPEEEIEEILFIMNREAGHLRELVEDILVIPRLETGHLRMNLQDIDLHKECLDVADVVFTGSTTDFDIAIPTSVKVIADPIRLRQVLRNLLENARKYGGDQVLVDGVAEDNLFQVSIADNGPGIPEADRERIFDHFEQLTKGDARAAQGVGLGLPIARNLVHAMGGALWYEARFPTGSRFCFTLPAAQVPASMAPLIEARPATDRRDRKAGPSPGPLAECRHDDQRPTQLDTNSPPPPAGYSASCSWPASHGSPSVRVRRLLHRRRVVASPDGRSDPRLRPAADGSSFSWTAQGRHVAAQRLARGHRLGRDPSPGRRCRSLPSGRCHWCWRRRWSSTDTAGVRRSRTVGCRRGHRPGHSVPLALHRAAPPAPRPHPGARRHGNGRVVSPRRQARGSWWRRPSSWCCGPTSTEASSSGWRSWARWLWDGPSTSGHCCAPQCLGVVTFVAGVANPYGFTAYIQTLVNTSESVTIEEWQPLSFDDARGVVHRRVHGSSPRWFS